MVYKRSEVGGNWGEIFQHADWHPKRSTCPVLTPFDNPEIGYHAKLGKPRISHEAVNRDYGDNCSGEIIPKASFCGIARVTPSLPREGEAACGGKPPKPPFRQFSLIKSSTSFILHKGEGRRYPDPIFISRFWDILSLPGGVTKKVVSFLYGLIRALCVLLHLL